MNAPTHIELVALAWAVRILGTLAVVLLLAFAAYWLLRGYLKITDRWNTIFALFKLWYIHCRKDRARLWLAVEKWEAWDHDESRACELDRERNRLRAYYQDRERFLRKTYDADYMPEDMEPGASSDAGTVGREDELL